MSGGPDPLYVRAPHCAARRCRCALRTARRRRARRCAGNPSSHRRCRLRYRRVHDRHRFLRSASRTGRHAAIDRNCWQSAGFQQGASRVTLAVTPIGETECMHRPFPEDRLRRQRRAPATEPGPGRTPRHGNDALRERRGARRTSERRIICQHQGRSLSLVRVHEQVGIGRVSVAAGRGALQIEADG